MARFMGKIAVANVLIPQADGASPEFYARLPRHNFIDDLVWNKLERLGIEPAPAPDQTSPTAG